MEDTKTIVFKDKPFSDLSEGQKQRVLIARALVGELELLILDEPTSAMDSLSESEVLHLIDEIKEERNLAILIVTHRFETISDRVTHLIVLDPHLNISTSDTIEKIVEDPKIQQLYSHVFSKECTS